MENREIGTSRRLGPDGEQGDKGPQGDPGPDETKEWDLREIWSRWSSEKDLVIR